LRVPVAAAFFAWILTFPTPSIACSLAGCLGNGVEVHRSFQVHISHDNKPLKGVTVEVRSFGGENNGTNLFSGMTASDGTVHIGSLPSGTYWLDAELLGITAGIQCFHVGSSASRKAKKQLTYEWGDLAPATRQIAGRLIDNQPGQGGTPIWNLLHRVDVPIGDAKLNLQNPLTSAAYTTVSNSDGEFSFRGIPNGIYVLHIDAGIAQGDREYRSTDLLIRLSDTAKRGTLLLARQEDSGTSCGDTSLKLLNDSQ
jgi:hypothetical protein